MPLPLPRHAIATPRHIVGSRPCAPAPRCPCPYVSHTRLKHTYTTNDIHKRKPYETVGLPRHRWRPGLHGRPERGGRLRGLALVFSVSRFQLLLGMVRGRRLSGLLCADSVLTRVSFASRNPDRTEPFNTDPKLHRNIHLTSLSRHHNESGIKDRCHRAISKTLLPLPLLVRPQHLPFPLLLSDLEKMGGCSRIRFRPTRGPIGVAVPPPSALWRASLPHLLSRLGAGETLPCGLRRDAPSPSGNADGLRAAAENGADEEAVSEASPKTICPEPIFRSFPPSGQAEG